MVHRLKRQAEHIRSEKNWLMHGAIPVMVTFGILFVKAMVTPNVAEVMSLMDYLLMRILLTCMFSSKISSLLNSDSDHHFLMLLY